MAENEKEEGSKWLKWMKSRWPIVVGIVLIILVLIIPRLVDISGIIESVTSTVGASIGSIMIILPSLLERTMNNHFDKLEKEREEKIQRSLEKYKSELAFGQRQREQAAKVAEALANWIATDKKKGIPSEEDLWKLHKSVWEVTLWLPDRLAKRFNDLLSWEEGENICDLIYDVRAYILYGEDENKAKESFKRGDKVMALGNAENEKEKTFSPGDIVVSFRQPTE